MGYGVLRGKEGSFDLQDFEMIDCGVVHPSLKLPLHQRLFSIYKTVKELIDKYRPDAIAVEDQFLGQAAFTSISKVSMSKVPLMIQAAKHNISYTEYSPRRVKYALTGKENAKKSEVEKAIRIVLPLDNFPLTEDASDALAIACCHLLTLKERGADG